MIRLADHRAFSDATVSYVIHVKVALLGDN